jgi:hypothetical protein
MEDEWVTVQIKFDVQETGYKIADDLAEFAIADLKSVSRHFVVVNHRFNLGSGWIMWKQNSREVLFTGHIRDKEYKMLKEGQLTLRPVKKYGKIEEWTITPTLPVGVFLQPK